MPLRDYKPEAKERSKFPKAIAAISASVHAVVLGLLLINIADNSPPTQIAQKRPYIANSTKETETKLEATKSDNIKSSSPPEIVPRLTDPKLSEIDFEKAVKFELNKENPDSDKIISAYKRRLKDYQKALHKDLQDENYNGKFSDFLIKIAAYHESLNKLAKGKKQVITVSELQEKWQEATQRIKLQLEQLSPAATDLEKITAMNKALVTEGILLGEDDRYGLISDLLLRDSDKPDDQQHKLQCSGISQTSLALEEELVGSKNYFPVNSLEHMDVAYKDSQGKIHLFPSRGPEGGIANGSRVVNGNPAYLVISKAAHIAEYLLGEGYKIKDFPANLRKGYNPIPSTVTKKEGNLVMRSYLHRGLYTNSPSESLATSDYGDFRRKAQEAFEKIPQMSIAEISSANFYSISYRKYQLVGDEQTVLSPNIRFYLDENKLTALMGAYEDKISAASPIELALLPVEKLKELKAVLEFGFISHRAPKADVIKKIDEAIKLAPDKATILKQLLEITDSNQFVIETNRYLSTYHDLPLELAEKIVETLGKLLNQATTLNDQNQIRSLVNYSQIHNLSPIVATVLKSVVTQDSELGISKLTEENTKAIEILDTRTSPIYFTSKEEVERYNNLQRLHWNPKPSIGNFATPEITTYAGEHAVSSHLKEFSSLDPAILKAFLTGLKSNNERSAKEIGISITHSNPENLKILFENYQGKINISCNVDLTLEEAKMIVERASKIPWKIWIVFQNEINKSEGFEYLIENVKTTEIWISNNFNIPSTDIAALKKISKAMVEGNLNIGNWIFSEGNSDKLKFLIRATYIEGSINSKNARSRFKNMFPADIQTNLEIAKLLEGGESGRGFYSYFNGNEPFTIISLDNSNATIIAENIKTLNAIIREDFPQKDRITIAIGNLENSEALEKIAQIDKPIKLCFYGKVVSPEDVQKYFTDNRSPNLKSQDTIDIDPMP